MYRGGAGGATGKKGKARTGKQAAVTERDTDNNYTQRQALGPTGQSALHVSVRAELQRKYRPPDLQKSVQALKALQDLQLKRLTAESLLAGGFIARVHLHYQNKHPGPLGYA